MRSWLQILSLSVLTCYAWANCNGLLADERYRSVTTSALQPPIPVCRYDFGPGDDRDVDDQPDDWVRRVGPMFPKYVRVGIDATTGRSDTSSLRIDADGGAAILYSPLTRVTGLHTLYFEAYVKTSDLQHDAAILSVSLLNQQRQRVQRFLTTPLQGTHNEWVRVQLGPIWPHEDVRFAVIGCHLQPGSGDRRDIGGAAWFDDLSLGRLPRMELESNFFSHFLSEEEPMRVSCHASGLDAGHDYSLHLKLTDAAEQLIEESTQRLEPDPAALQGRDLTEYLQPHPVRWELARQPPGFYRVRSRLLRNDVPVSEQETTLAVVKLVKTPRPSGEFGWSITKPLGPRERQELPQVVAQAGIHWLKYPLWDTVQSEDPRLAGEVSTLLQQLTAQKLIVVGVLSDPPPQIRSKFARSWLGVSEVFHLPPDFWRGALEPIVARYSSMVNHWQLGSDQDHSFVGMPGLVPTLNNVRQEIQRISLSASLGLAWPLTAEVPPAAARLGFLSRDMNLPAARSESGSAGPKPGDDGQTDAESGSSVESSSGDASSRSASGNDPLANDGTGSDPARSPPGGNDPQSLTNDTQASNATAETVAQPDGGADTPRDRSQSTNNPPLADSLKASGAADWRVIRLKDLQGNTHEARAAHLVRQLVAARLQGTQAIFVDDVYHAEHGLLKPNGAPAELFLPWRTFVLTLQNSASLGNLVFPHRSPNAVFARDGSAVVVVWNETPTEESLYLGENVVAVDVWGRQRPLTVDPQSGEQKITVGPVPQLLVNCSEAIMRWRIATQFELGQMKSEYGGHQDALLGRNTFPQGVTGTVSLVLPPEWEAEPREWPLQVAAQGTFRFPVSLTLPTHASLGQQDMAIDFRIVADRPYRFRVYRDYKVGLGDVVLKVVDRKLPDGRLEIEQLVINRTVPEEVLEFRCSLFVPGDKRQKLQVTRLGTGTDRKFYYLQNAERFRGAELWLRLEQDGGRRIMNYRWKVGADWE
jgi:hypothetical protein